jgi:hypothetical protein
LPSSLILSTFLISAALISVLPLKLARPKLSDSSSKTFASLSRACTISSAGFEEAEGKTLWLDEGDSVDFDAEDDLTTCGLGAKVDELEAVGAG